MKLSWRFSCLTGGMRSTLLLATAIVFAGCSRFGGKTSVATAAATPEAILTASLQCAASDESLSALAARKGRLPETRQFGESMGREATALRAELAALAERRKLPAADLAEKQVALRQNLDILPGQVFDRGYSLAMVQDLTATITRLDAAHDQELAAIGARHKTALTEQLKLANATLDRLGGSPFGFVP